VTAHPIIKIIFAQSGKENYSPAARLVWQNRGGDARHAHGAHSLVPAFCARDSHLGYPTPTVAARNRWQPDPSYSIRLAGLLCGRPSEIDIPAITVHSGMQYFNQSQAECRQALRQKAEGPNDPFQGMRLNEANGGILLTPFGISSRGGNSSNRDFDQDQNDLDVY
jgi:hypothetical protein